MHQKMSKAPNSNIVFTVPLPVSGKPKQQTLDSLMKNQSFEPNGLSAKSSSECLKEPEASSISDIGLHYEDAKTLDNVEKFRLFSNVW